MYKYYKQDEFDIMYYRFDSITEYLEHLENSPIDKTKFPKCESITNDYEFTKTHSYEEAVELCKYGYHEKYNELINLKLQLEKYIKITFSKNMQYNDYIGYVPDVKAYLEGNPLSMLNKINPLKKKIDIYFNTSYNWFTTNDQIYNRGAITLVLVEMLENLGYSVDLHLFELVKKNSQLYYANYILKNECERMNIQKLYFPMCHPSWLRRLYFRCLEGTPDINAAWGIDYGQPQGIDMARKIIDLNKNDIVISQPCNMKVMGLDIIDDANNMFDIINKDYNRDLVLEKVMRKR